MLLTKKTVLLVISCVCWGVWSCNKWDDHTAIGEPALDRTLEEEIANHANLSVFNSYLQKTGLDEVLNASKNYTVWAPDNDALQDLSTDVVNDTALLKAFLLNHIAGQLNFTSSDTVRVPMLNGKRVFFYGNTFDEATVTEGNIYVKNGVLHIIDADAAPLPSIWEYIEDTRDSYQQNEYIASQVYLAQDPEQAELDSINPATGDPVYKPNTGIVEINTFLTKVYDVADEDSLYTYILLKNTAFTDEVNEQMPYFMANDADTTSNNASWNVVKDLAIHGLYRPDELPAALVSRFGVHVPMTAIAETHRVSNGIVYVLDDVSFDMAEKIPTFMVQGETPIGFSFTDDNTLNKVFYRERMNQVTGEPFKDIYINFGSSGLNAYIDYFTNNLYTTTYDVYWVALNDRTVSAVGDDPYGTTAALRQILMIGDYNTTPFVAGFSQQMDVQPNEYNEVYIGQYTNDNYNWLLSYPANTPDGSSYTFNNATRRLRLQVPSSSQSGVPNNITLDYLKFVPVL